MVYLHGDHLGSTLILSRQNGTYAGQWYTPWGDRRTPPAISETSREYTGQKRDGTGLLFYNARYYDPALGRFISPDTIVPGTSAGSGGAAATVGSGATSSLTVDFHEGGFLSQLNGVNAQRQAQGFWFESGEGESPSGPANPQALNRYSYVLNNPLRYTDPSGHIPCTCYFPTTRIFAQILGNAAMNWVGRKILDAAGGQISMVVGQLGSAVIDQMLKSAGSQFPHNTDHRWTNAGRALQKHSSRPGSAWNAPTGAKNPQAYNELAQQYVEEILNNPNNVAKVTATNRPGWGGWQTDIFLPDGRGIRFNAFNEFMGFLEP